MVQEGEELLRQESARGQRQVPRGKAFTCDKPGFGVVAGSALTSHGLWAEAHSPLPHRAAPVPTMTHSDVSPGVMSERAISNVTVSAYRCAQFEQSKLTPVPGGPSLRSSLRAPAINKTILTLTASDFLLKLPEEFPFRVPRGAIGSPSRKDLPASHSALVKAGCVFGTQRSGWIFTLEGGAWFVAHGQLNPEICRTRARGKWKKRSQERAKMEA
eukprot:29357-Rhodomonas_salina.4